MNETSQQIDQRHEDIYYRGRDDGRASATVDFIERFGDRLTNEEKHELLKTERELHAPQRLGWENSWFNKLIRVYSYMKDKLKLKKGISQVEAIKSARKTWGFKPTSRVVNSRKVYERKWRRED